jgi:2-polyprenyl-6-methoxyphenol hydroxylase-like FAD-dependent oxidoreductase
MTTIRTVLISGCSIAGPTLAYWLRERGFVPTIVERSSSPRPGGQAIDVRGKALDVLERMQVLDATRASKTTLRGMSVQDKDGQETWRSEEMTLSGGRFDAADVEILRDDLVAILTNAARGVETIWGESIAALREEPDGVEVTFRNGGTRPFDIVVGADGVHSNVRRLAFGEEGPLLRDMGIGLAVFSVPNDLGLSDWQIVHRAGPKSACAVYTTRHNRELRVTLGFPASADDECRGDIAAQKRLVARRTADFGWHVPRFLRAMEHCSDFYFGVAAQVKMGRWSTGRVALVGDAAHCPSPLSGQGTSLALVGAYVLGAELGAHRDEWSSAFTAYEARMRPYVALNQALVDAEQGDAVASERLKKAKNAITL